jgi:hypothetical protein
MREFRLPHPSNDGSYFVFVDDGTYMMFTGKREISQRTSLWKLEEAEGRCLLVYANTGETKWRPFWNGVHDTDIRHSYDFGEKLLTWITSMQLLGDEEYVIEN